MIRVTSPFQSMTASGTLWAESVDTPKVPTGLSHKVPDAVMDWKGLVTLIIPVSLLP